MDYKKPCKKFSDKFISLVEESNNILITGHKSPDDDSISSVLAAYTFLKDFFPSKKSRMIYTGEPVDRYKIFTYFDKIKFVKDIADYLSNFDLLIMFDGSQFSRFTNEPDKIKSFPGRTICIDHHSSPVDNFSLSLIVPTASSAVELFYQSFYKEKQISKKLAEIFLLGILGDTGNFSYLKPNQTETLLTAKRLLDISKIEIQEFLSGYRYFSKRIFNIIQELIKNTQYDKSFDWPSFQYSFINRDFVSNDSYTDVEVSEAYHIYMVHYLRIIEGYPWGFVVTPKTSDQCNVSLRSLPRSVSCRDIMERMGLGGGHDRAAGGTFDSRIVADCVKQLLTWIKSHKPVVI